MAAQLKSRFFAILFSTLATLFGLIFPTTARGDERIRYVPGELVVKFRPNVPGHVMADIHRGAAARLVKTFWPDPRLQHVRIPRNWPLESAIAYYSTRADVQYVERNLIYKVRNTTPNDQQFPTQWNWENTGQLPGGIVGADVHAPGAWDKARGRFTLVVGHIDTGVDYTHPDLALNIWTNPTEAGVKCANGLDDGLNGYIDDCRGWNFVANNNNPMDDNFHGTHTAGTIGAQGNNVIGVTGATWDVQIMPIKAFDSTGSGTTVNIISAIDYALANGAKVLNASWGGPGFSQFLADAIERANAAGVLFVTTAGDSGTNLDAAGTKFYPCANTNANIICVGAVAPSGDLSSYSNYGSATVHIAAPGDNINSTVLNQNYGVLTGTSMATAHVTGAVALIKGCKGALTASTIKSTIIGNPTLNSSLNGKTTANGMVNYEAAINAATAGGACDPLPANALPVADSGGPYNSNAKKPIQFNGTGSSDSDGQILLYFWDFGDGSLAMGPKPTHQYANPGAYAVTLTVRDNLGGTDTTTSVANVRPTGKALGPVTQP